MNAWVLWLRAAVLLSLATGTGMGQVEMSGAAPELPGAFFLDAIAFSGTSPGQARLDVFLQVGYEGLTFVKEDDKYSASYDLSLSISDSAGGLVSEKAWTEEVKGLTFDQSVSSSAYKLSQRSIPITPGSYRVSASLRDNESKAVRRIETRLPVTDFTSGDFALSDILLLSRVTEVGQKRTIVPIVSSNVGDLPDFFYLFTEAYNRLGIDSARVVLSVLNEKQEKVLETDTVLALHSGRNEEILKVPNGSFPLGDYRLYLRAYRLQDSARSDTGYLASTNRAFLVRWEGMPRNLNDLDLAIDQLRYIAKDKELSYLKEASTAEEKQKRFLEFWKKRDPNPNTPRNEKMEEYYRRVEYANRHFGHYTAGWRTDMGMVYLIFGPPSNVERHPFEIDTKPYEIWTYFELNYSFVFLDETGFGDYRLVTPLWEVYDRARLLR